MEGRRDNAVNRIVNFPANGRPKDIHPSVGQTKNGQIMPPTPSRIFPLSRNNRRFNIGYSDAKWKLYHADICKTTCSKVSQISTYGGFWVEYIRHVVYHSEKDAALAVAPMHPDAQ